MKKFLFLLMLGGALLSFNSCGTNYDALASGIHFDTMNSDTNFENFRHASDETQVSVLRDLCEVLDKVYHYPMPNVMHRDSTDFRGIDVAILSRIKPAQVTWIRPGTGLRDSVAADFKVGPGRFTVIGNHWKSRWGDKKQSDATRSFMASKVRAHWSYLLGKDPAAAIIVNFRNSSLSSESGFTERSSEASVSSSRMMVSSGCSSVGISTISGFRTVSVT